MKEIGTERLYYDIPIKTECNAKVTDCCSREGKYLVALDKTVIFPEGGGQISDCGNINGFTVSRADENGPLVFHECDVPFEIGQEVKVSLSIKERLDHTEQHTGEHILSGLAKKMFNACNVGFHMADDYCTIDLDKILTEDELLALEIEANSVVRNNLPIHTVVINADELDTVSLRKRADGISGEARIVYIDGGKVDSCTCCGTHFESTGRVGAIKITDSQKYKGGTRLWFSCGGRAVELAARIQNDMTELARRFSTSRDDLKSAVVKQSEELALASRSLKQKSLLIADMYSDRLIARSLPINGVFPIVAMTDVLTANDAKLIADAIVNKKNSIALIFAVSEAGTAYRMACTKGVRLSMKELCTAVNYAVGGKGGGSPVFAQGSAPTKVSQEICDMLLNYIKNVLKG